MSTTPALMSEAGQTKPDFSLFEQYQSKFRELYLEQNKSLAQVKVEMETSYGFPATDTKIYEYGLRHLRFIKKLPIKGWIEVEVCAKKRKEREGKDTEVYLSGIKHPWDKIRRRISRHKNEEQVRKRICSRSTPDCPEGVVLKTPPLSPRLIVATLPPNFTQTPTPPLTISTSGLGIYSINIRPSTSFQLELSSNKVWARMLSNPSSTAYFLSTVPSNQLMDPLRQTISDSLPAFHSKQSYEIDVLSFRSQSQRPHNFTPASQPDLGVGIEGPYVSLDTQAQTESMEVLGKLCIMLANGDTSQIADPTELLTWIGMNTNKQVLKAFFALELPAVAATWSRLIHLSRDFDSGDAFQTLVEAGLETHDGEWIRQHAAVLIRAMAEFGSKRIGGIAQRLLSRESHKIFPYTNTRDIEHSIWDIIEHQDVEMMSMFSGAGINLWNINSIVYSTLVSNRSVSLHPKFTYNTHTNLGYTPTLTFFNYNTT
ncbi:hypothetical protein F4803DRAFT_550603 [Xylaria telfairii]|nr:hypothetical protein F4803DRAFT_550603 [Xylaria telfairii]